MPGVFAAGDARYRSIKRVASAVGDGATAVRLTQEYLALQNAVSQPPRRRRRGADIRGGNEIHSRRDLS